MSKDQPRGLFPSQSKPVSEKRQKKYGKEVAKAIEAEWFKQDNGADRFFGNRDKFHQLRLYARGEQPIQKYKNELSVNGDLSYLNLDWKIVPIIPKFVDIVVNGIAERHYDIKTYAQDPASIQEKTEYVEKLERDMKNRELIEAIGQQFGMNMFATDPDNLPESQEELELKMQLDFKLPIEVAEEEVINNVFDYNKYHLLKKRFDYDIMTIGIGATRNSFNTAEGIKLDYVDPADLVYSYTEDPYFGDIYYVGEVRRMSITELKKEYPDLTAEEIKEIEGKNSGGAVQSRMYNTINAADTNHVWVLFFEYKTFEEQVWKIKETSTGGAKAIKKEDTFNPPKDKRARFEKVSRAIEVIYTGAKVIGCDSILEWKLAENMVRPKSDTTKASFSYNIVAPRMYRGRIESLVGRMRGFADMIQLTHLKLQQVLSRMVPDGVYLDADALAEIDLGNGTNYNPQEALNMFFQTGSVIGRSMTIDGDINHSQMPIQELKHSAAGQKIQALITSYNYYLQMIRDVTGLNEARDGSTPDKDTLVGLQKLAAANSNTATRHIVEAGLYLALRDAEAISLRVSDVLEYGNTTSSFISSIGKFNVSTLKMLEELHLHDFGIFIELAPDEEQKQILENNIQMALQREQIYLEDAIDVREIRNLKLANQLLKLRRRKKLERDRQENLENIAAQEESNARAAERAAAAEAQKEQAVAESKIMVNQAQVEFDVKKLEREAAIKKELMTYEFELNMKLKEMEMQVINKNEEYKEDRKDERTKIQASQQSELIDQRNSGKPPKNFESKGFDNLDGFGLEQFSPK